MPLRPTRNASLLAMILVAAAPIVGVIMAMIVAPGPLGKTVFVLCKVWMLAVPLFWLLKVQGRPLSLSPARRGGVGVGALLGVFISVAVVAGYWLIGRGLIDADHVREMAVQNGIGTKTVFLLGLVYWITLNSLLEEFVYRWFLFRRAEALFGGGAAVFISALLFTVHHVIALRVQFDWTITILGSAGVFIGGAIWSWLYWRYRSIWPGYVSHAIVDIAVFGIGWYIIFGGA